MSGKTPVDLLVTGKWLVTVDEQHTIIAQGALAVSGQDIVAVGSATDIAAMVEPAEHIDAPEHVIMPGLINGHTHFGDSLFRSLVGDIALEDWLTNLWKAEGEFVNADNVGLAVRLALAESIKGGTTAALDMFWFPEEAAKEAKKAGFRLVTGPVFLDIGMPYDLAPEQIRDFFAEYRDDSLISMAIQPHGTYTVGPDLLQKTYAYADEYDALYHIHASETVAEVSTVQEKYNRTPIEQLEAYNLLTDKTVLAHAVHLNEEEIALVAERSSKVAHCPVCNCKLGSGVAPVPAMLDVDIPVMLGTDGPVSSNDLDLWTHMRFAATLHRGVHQDPLLMQSADVLAMTTRNAAQALNLGFTGSLKVGQRADFILVNMGQPHLAPVYELYSHLMYSVGRADVETVVIDGQVVMRDRQLLTIDEAQTLADLSQLAPKIDKFING